MEHNCSSSQITAWSAPSGQTPSDVSGSSAHRWAIGLGSQEAVLQWGTVASVLGSDSDPLETAGCLCTDLEAFS